MKLIKPSYEIKTPINGEEILKSIELAARDCYQSDGKIEYELYHMNAAGNPFMNRPTDSTDIIEIAKSARVLIPKLMNLNHEAMLEFGGMIHVRFIVDRGVSHELVRHRVASFAQESTRYCNYGKDEHIQFIIPSWLALPEGIYAYNGVDDLYGRLEDNSYVKVTDGREPLDNNAHRFLYTIETCESSYNELLKNGWAPQQARSVLPNSLKTTINISCNIREWRHILKLRTAKAAHPQMREVMCPLLDEFKSKIPILFDDINY